jgi:glycosyltransferase involved in cell wall biosynthesis
MAINLIAPMRDLGFDFSIVAQRAGGELWDRLPEGTSAFCLGARSRPAAILALARLFRDRPPDVLMSSSAEAACALLARQIARAPTRIVLRQHGPFDRDVCPPFRAAKRVVYRTLLSRSDAFVAVSEGVADDMAQYFALERSAVTVIYNPAVTADAAELAKEPIDHPFFVEQTSPIFVGVGRLVGQKDFATLIAAFAAYRQHTPSRLAIIGDGPLRGALEE